MCTHCNYMHHTETKTMLIHARIHAPLPSLSEGCGKIQNSKINEGVRIRNGISQELKKKTYLEIKNVEMLVV